MSKKSKTASEPSNSHVEPRQPGWIEWTRSIGIAIILALLIRWPVAEPYKIPSGSMEPTFMPGDRIFVDKHVYGIRYPMNGFRFPFTRKNMWYADTYIFEGKEVQRWDIAVFKSIEPGAEHDTLVKRIVGLPGERIHVRGDGALLINGEPIDIPDYMPDVKYTNPQVGGQYGSNGYAQLTDDEHSLIPEGHYFLMGDNSGSSRDARWFGFMPKHHLLGRVTSIWWPLDRWIDFTGYTHKAWWSIMWGAIAFWTVWRLFFGRSWKARCDSAGGIIKKGEHVFVRFSMGLPIPFTGIRLTRMTILSLMTATPSPSSDEKTRFTKGSLLKVGDLVFYHPRTAAHRHVEGLLGIVGGVGGDRVFMNGDQLRVNDKKVGGNFETLRYPKEGTEDRYGRSKGKEFSEVPEGHVFILSQPGGSDDDSRTIGWIPHAHIVGTVTRVWWPLTKMRGLPRVKKV